MSLFWNVKDEEALTKNLQFFQETKHLYNELTNGYLTLQTWLNYLIQSGESKQRTDDVKGSIIELDIANCIYEENIKDKSALLRNIKTGLARSYFKLGNCKQALKNLEDCSKLYDDFFVVSHEIYSYESNSSFSSY